MSEAQASRAEDVKSLNNKREHKAILNEKRVSANELKAKTEQEIHNIDIYLVQLEAECGFLLRNYEVRHEGRVEEEQGLESAESIVTGEEPPTHREIEKNYEEEHSDKDVEENWPETFGKE